MTLPSQAARSTPMARSTVFRRHRRSPVVPVAAVGSIIAVVAAAWWVFGRGDGLSSHARAEAQRKQAALSASVAREGPPQGAGTPDAARREPQAVTSGQANPAKPNPIAPNDPATTPGTLAGDIAATRLAQNPPPSPPGRAPPEATPTVPGPGAPATPLTSLPPAGGDGGKGEASAAQKSLAAADQLVKQGDPIKARATLNSALRAAGATQTETQTIRERLTALNDDLLFGPKIHPGEGNTEQYTVAAGDNLVKIVKARGLHTQFRLIARVNKLASPDKISLGQRLKLVRGPFHAVVSKSAFRMDVFVGPAEKPESWVYVRSFRVGLGEGDSTPVGTFVVKQNSKLENPFWVNPRTGEKFAANDPKNPIGERWIGLEGQGEAAVYQGYGIHGTIEPDSIGQMRSMGCVRLGPDDVEFVYQLLGEGVSIVRIEP